MTDRVQSESSQLDPTDAVPPSNRSTDQMMHPSQPTSLDQRESSEAVESSEATGAAERAVAKIERLQHQIERSEDEAQSGAPSGAPSPTINTAPQVGADVDPNSVPPATPGIPSGKLKQHFSDVENGRRALLQCVHQIITAPRQRDAVDALVRRIGFECPGAAVRLAVGRRRIEQFYDSRLGWLPRGNAIREKAAEEFRVAVRDRDLSERFAIVPVDRDSDPSQAKSVDAENAGEQVSGEQVSGEPSEVAYDCIDLSPPDNDDERRRRSGPSKAFVLMMRPQAGEQVFRRPPAWLVDGAGMLATALASRPTMVLPRWANLIGARPLGTVFVTLLLLGGIGLWPVPYPVSCAVVVAPTKSRVIAAPFEATLLSTAVMPGDNVTRGQILFQLDGRPLRIEIDAIESEMRAAEKDANIALANHKIGEMQRANMTRNKLLHRADLLRRRLGQLSVASPIDGVVMGGDLRRHIGTPLTVGQTLIEVAPISQIALEIEIPEFEVNLLHSGATARVRFDAVGGRSQSVPLESIDPSSEIRDDQNVFVGRLTMENVDNQFRPGMKGDAVVYGPVRPLAWSFLRPWWERLLWAIGY